MQRHLIGIIVGLALCCFGQGCPGPQELQPDSPGGDEEVPRSNPCLRAFYSQTYGFAFDPPLKSTGPIYETPSETYDLVFKYEAGSYVTVLVMVHTPLDPPASLEVWRESYLSNWTPASDDLVTNDTFITLDSGAEAWWFVRYNATHNDYLEHIYVYCGPRIMFFSIYYGSYLSNAEVADLRRALFSLCVDN